jgi:hypothetical protein
LEIARRDGPDGQQAMAALVALAVQEREASARGALQLINIEIQYPTEGAERSRWANAIIAILPQYRHDDYVVRDAMELIGKYASDHPQAVPALKAVSQRAGRNKTGRTARKVLERITQG